MNPQNVNRYAYVTNNPLRYFDPDGQEKLEVIVRTFIPQNFVVNPVPLAGDGRNAGETGTYRTEQRVVIETDPSGNGGSAAYGTIEGSTGKSFGIVIGGNGVTAPGGVGLSGATPLSRFGETQAPGNTLGGEVTRSDGAVNVHVHGNETYQGIPGAPGITYNFDIKVQSEGPQGTATVSVTGAHDKFPAYEIIVVRPEAENSGQTVVYQSDPRQTGNTGWSLIPLAPNRLVNPPPVEISPKQRAGQE